MHLSLQEWSAALLPATENARRYLVRVGQSRGEYDSAVECVSPLLDTSPQWGFFVRACEWKDGLSVDARRPAQDLVEGEDLSTTSHTTGWSEQNVCVSTNVCPYRRKCTPRKKHVLASQPCGSNVQESSRRCRGTVLLRGSRK
jgi:hypothetical protein